MRSQVSLGLLPVPDYVFGVSADNGPVIYYIKYPFDASIRFAHQFAVPWLYVITVLAPVTS